MKGRLGTTEQVEAHIAKARKKRLKVKQDRSAGTVEIFDGDVPVLRAMQKGRGSKIWVCIFRSTERVQWLEEEM